MQYIFSLKKSKVNLKTQARTSTQKLSLGTGFLNFKHNSGFFFKTLLSIRWRKEMEQGFVSLGQFKK